MPSRGKVVIGTVKGDLHDIGKNLVGIMLKGAGFEVIDLGHDVAPERFVDTAVREEATLIGMSALLTTTMTGMKEVVAAPRASGGSPGKVRTIVGGAPSERRLRPRDRGGRLRLRRGQRRRPREGAPGGVTWTRLLERLRRGEVLVGDGAWGTQLMERGLPPGQPPESFALEQPGGPRGDRAALRRGRRRPRHHRHVRRDVVPPEAPRPRRRARRGQPRRRSRR